MKQNYFFLWLIFPLFLLGQTTITSTEPIDLSAYTGATNLAGQGEYELFLSADNILDKPIILVDGFDPGDSRDIPGLYALLDYAGPTGTENLADLLRGEGYDVVILNFPMYMDSNNNEVDGGADFIERNAMVLVELINVINNAKATNSPEQNVIIGPSMGGLISRFALNYMESETLNADTRLFISFDAPHHGANIPIGLQHQLNYLAFNDTQPTSEVQPIINDLLKSPAARQLLVDHFESHLASGSTIDFDPSLTLPQEHPFRTSFVNSINALTTDGFPQNVRNVAITNGSGIGSPYFAMGNSGTTVTNGFTVISTVIPVTVASPFGDITLDVEIDINLTPAAGTPAQVSRFFAPVPIVADIESSASSGRPNFDGIDAAPGGLFDLSAITGELSSGGGLAADFLNALQIDKFNFIPTVSALALEITDNEIDWFHSIDLAGRATTNNTPFDNTYLPDDNEPHVQLTQGNVAFAMMEIMSPSLGVNNENIIAFQLEKNPISDNLIIRSSQNTKAEVYITDVSGKLVYNSVENLENRNIIAINLASGFYILNITSANNATYTTKFLVN